ncbi:uncharacterized protein LOC133189850 [Saccostrea echinata]|uniref:uncharacterized protein LOC133189850 n=1 Tax=Saccostrea echinata TaxID=191078 RepID=UPI002A818CC7|nr:uncharacterized protein LOC133189850 [Saccostrea echinata]
MKEWQCLCFAISDTKYVSNQKTSYYGTRTLLLFCTLIHASLFWPTVLLEIKIRIPTAEEKALVENMTSWIQNETIKTYMSSHLLLCPNQDMCFGDKFKRNYTYEQKIHSCSLCSCSDECFRKKNCCPWRNYVQSKNSTPNFITYLDHRVSKPSRYDNIPLVCRKAVLHEKFYVEQGYFMISSCPDHFVDAEIVRKCQESENDERDYRRAQPVTSLRSNETFKNRDCALCNEEPPETLLAWTTRLFCKEAKDTFQITSEEELQRKLFVPSPFCNVDFLPPSNIMEDKVRKCYTDNMLEKKCNGSKDWEKFDSETERGCHMDYVSPYTHCKPINTHQTFKNIYCAMCNVKNWTKDLAIECDDDFSIGTIKFSFSALLDFSGSYSKKDAQPRECPEQQIYDPLMRKCLQINCGSSLMYENNECVPIHKMIDHHFYEINLIFTPHRRDTNTTVLGALSAILDELLRNNDIQRHMTVLHSMSNEDDRYRNSVEDSDFYIAVYVELKVKELHNHKKYMENLIDIFRFSSSLSKTFKIEIIGQSFSSKYYPMFLSGQVVKFFQNPFSADLWYPQLTIPGKIVSILNVDRYMRSVLAPVTLCPRVTIHKSQTKVIVSKLTLCLVDYNFCVKSEYFTESPDKAKVEVCVDQYVQGMNAAFSISLKSFTEERVLSMICLSLSSFGCIGSVVTLIIHDEIKHLYGLNVVSTSIHLLLANIFYFLSTVSPFSSILCMTVGAITHFLWLSVMTWMTSSCFSFFRMFTTTRLTKLETPPTRKKFLWNMFCSFFFPFSMVSLNVLISFLVFPNHSYGYSMFTCYISKPEMIFYTFALPLAVMVVLNIFMVIMTARRIKIRRSASLLLDNDRRMVLIFCRLSTLTGGAWLFGFFHQIFQIQVFSYLHILSTGTQGVFIFFAFAFQLISKSFKTWKMEKTKSQATDTAESM